MTGNTGSDAGQEQRQPIERRGRTDLDDRYGAIGIMAVAAAVRYAGSGKNPAYAPVVPQHDRHYSEFAV
jgi:hypothetical protein